MKLTTPPKLIPPFHNTAASGTLPTEQTKLTIATNGLIPYVKEEHLDKKLLKGHNPLSNKRDFISSATKSRLMSPVFYCLTQPLCDLQELMAFGPAYASCATSLMVDVIN